MSTRYRSLTAIPEFVPLMATSLVARLPTGLISLALLLLARDRYGSFTAASVVVAAYALANAVFMPVQGVWVDRIGQARVLAPCALTYALLLLLVAFVASPTTPVAALAALAGLAGAVCPPIGACTRAMWGNVATDVHSREVIYLLDSIGTESIWIAGPLLLSAFLVLASPVVAILFAAVVTASGVMMYLTLSTTRSRPRTPPRGSPTRALTVAGLRVLLLSILLVGAAWGALSIGLPAVAVRDATSSMAGVLLALLSAGSVVGGVCYASRSWAGSMAHRYQLLLAMISITATPFALVASSLPLTGAVCVLAGLSWAPAISCQFTLTSRLAPRGAVTEAFGWVNSAFGFGVSVGALAGGAATALGVSTSFLLASSLTLFATGITVVRGREIDPSRPLGDISAGAKP